MARTLTVNLATIARFAVYLSVLAALATLFYFWRTAPNPTPDDIKKQLNFKVIYPSTAAGYSIDQASWNYQSQSQLLTFKAINNKTSIIMSEQKTPAAFADNSSAYNQMIVSIRPYLQFNSSLGNIAVTKFWIQGNFSKVGQTAVLNSHGTFFLAHPNQDLTDDQWQLYLNSLKVSR